RDQRASRHHDGHHPDRDRRRRRSTCRDRRVHPRGARGGRMSLSAQTQVGTEQYSTTVAIDRARLVSFAGSSGAFYPIHWNERFATDVGLPGVIAHGMLTMGIAGAALTDWLGDPGRLVSYGCRFTRPVVVPDPGEVEVAVRGVVGAVDA